MKTYYIDGNNLIGKIKILRDVQQKDKQSSREKLAHMLDRYFITRKYKVILFLDGYPNLAINTSKIKILYSENKTADEIIRREIERNKNPRNLIVVTSDRPVMDFSRACHCEVIQSNVFAAEILKAKNTDEEEEIKKSIPDNDIKKLFGI